MGERADLIDERNDSPPMEFDELLKAAPVSARFKEEVQSLISRKKASQELGVEPAIPVINDFIREKIAYFESRTGFFNPAEKPGAEYLDELLWEIAGLRT